jgi:hypothetical protein
LHRKRALAQALDKLMMGELLPRLLDVGAIKDVFQEPTTGVGQSISYSSFIGYEDTYGAKGMV